MSPIQNCSQCGRDTKNKGGICRRCMGGVRQHGDKAKRDYDDGRPTGFGGAGAFSRGEDPDREAEDVLRDETGT